MMDGCTDLVLTDGSFASLERLVNSYKTPLHLRLKRSKMRKLLPELSNKELLAVFYVLGFSHKALDVIKVWLSSVDPTLAKYCIILELQKRKLIMEGDDDGKK